MVLDYYVLTDNLHTSFRGRLWRNAVWRIGGHVVSPEEGKAAFRQMLGRRRISIMLDNAVIEYYKALAGGRGYQTLTNEALRAAMDRETLEATLRRVVREEIERRDHD